MRGSTITIDNRRRKWKRRSKLSVVSRLRREYFVGLLGYCLEPNNMILIYQFATKGSLHDTLHG
ncbi:putative protein kinase [Iris pallida]|uniref:Uncharacterized protein n=1 Tax=Iris pallida TaxID=29817 RepID=A0AAX6HM94_IRIPA|nr:putative protein kinase [Iris pallida]